MARYLIFHADGTIFFGQPAEQNEAEYPAPHGLSEGSVAMQIYDDDHELSSTEEPEGFDEFEASVLDLDYDGRTLLRKSTGGPLRVKVVEKFRLVNGFLEDKTLQGWRRRAIFEPFVDDNGEEIEGPDGEPEGQWYRQGPFDGKTRNLIPIDEPEPGDRRIWKGPRGNPIPEEWNP